MHVPTEEELAAIAAAYLGSQRARPQPAPRKPGWKRPSWRDSRHE